MVISTEQEFVAATLQKARFWSELEERGILPGANLEKRLESRRKVEERSADVLAAIDLFATLPAGSLYQQLTPGQVENRADEVLLLAANRVEVHALFNNLHA